jgi:hypothetical protein
MNNCVCPECGETSTSKKACSMEKCSECDVALENDEGTNESKKDKLGKGHSEVINEDTKVDDEDEAPSYMKTYLKILKEKKI